MRGAPANGPRPRARILIETSTDGVNWFDSANTFQRESGAQNDLFGVAYGNGLFAAFDAPGTEVRTRLRTGCFQRGLIILPSGERSIRFRPALNVSEEEIDEGISIIRAALKTL